MRHVVQVVQLPVCGPVGELGVEVALADDVQHAVPLGQGGKLSADGRLMRCDPLLPQKISFSKSSAEQLADPAEPPPQGGGGVSRAMSGIARLHNLALAG
ncbi:MULTISPECIES: hypothetical protein [unclassified Streptomyces]|uniref:hypothetical protein n=1 Tax=Streptomyces sp. NPDC127532 TaxID=3345399 RepID=UPI0036417993